MLYLFAQNLNLIRSKISENVVCGMKIVENGNSEWLWGTETNSEGITNCMLIHEAAWVLNKFNEFELRGWRTENGNLDVIFEILYYRWESLWDVSWRFSAFLMRRSVSCGYLDSIIKNLMRKNHTDMDCKLIQIFYRYVFSRVMHIENRKNPRVFGRILQSPVKSLWKFQG